MTDLRTPAPQDRIVEGERPSRALSAWMREVTRQSRRVDALVAALIAEGSLPAGWEDE